MAPANEYVSGGGKLKLKGAPVLEGRVGKKGNKKKSKKVAGEGGEKDKGKGEAEGVGSGGEGSISGGASASRSRGVSESAERGGEKVLVGKTEAERKYEEARRKRLDERLKREGVKTHKERVEELNKYLSNLSEHHDMYVMNLYLTFPPASLESIDILLSQPKTPGGIHATYSE
ncbi:hypothetical protein AJ79_04822 [Helicocarpus griseus UAMH5409]|uniref:DUF1754-domain-containing protein n=1 Tax=Helicocarpus griseus UAMH5409 TaxID=1447875 RepID=A0A2B7XIL0_9EURO|nr:hypothetical protein AJ79_04822 [Helicocarpus griseus UAMH5409]